MVHGSRRENLSALLEIKGHKIIAGLSEKIGGNDEGPNPHEIIEAGLAACTILTCQLYANRKQWNLVSTDVTVRITSETEEGSQFHREVKFVGDLTHEQRMRLLEIANKTPVYNLLTRPIHIDTKLVED